MRKFLLDKMSFTWFMMGCSVLSLVSALLILATDDNSESSSSAFYFCAFQTLIFSLPGLVIWLQEKCGGYCYCNELSETSIEVLFAFVYALTLGNVITMTLLNPMFFWNGLTALQRSFSTVDVIITVTYTLLFEIRVFFWCTTREERQREAEQRINLLHQEEAQRVERRRVASQRIN